MIQTHFLPFLIDNICWTCFFVFMDIYTEFVSKCRFFAVFVSFFIGFLGSIFSLFDELTYKERFLKDFNALVFLRFFFSIKCLLQVSLLSIWDAFVVSFALRLRFWLCWPMFKWLLWWELLIKTDLFFFFTFVFEADFLQTEWKVSVVVNLVWVLKDTDLSRKGF